MFNLIYMFNYIFQIRMGELTFLKNFTARCKVQNDRVLITVMDKKHLIKT